MPAGELWEAERSADDRTWRLNRDTGKRAPPPGRCTGEKVCKGRPNLAVKIEGIWGARKAYLQAALPSISHYFLTVNDAVVPYEEVMNFPFHSMVE